jgi:dienelactone hydrolase
MRKLRVVAAIAVAIGLASCAYPGPDGYWLGATSEYTTPTVTPRLQPITWGSAPNIDEHYGGTLYEGTALEVQDPRPPLVGDRQPLRAWVASPGNGFGNQPAIVWVHGGGFAVGVNSMHGLANTTGREFAERGYVSISVEYRIDTTLIGTGARPPSLCQWVQDNPAPGDPTWEARRAQCQRNVLAAQHDVQAFVRWLRANAATYNVNPDKIVVAGFSAGAVTALNLAYRSDDIGTDTYFAGDPRTSEASEVQAALAASGCVYGTDLGASPDIGAGDAPVSIIASELDQALPYGCVVDTVEAARAAGLTAELTSYCDVGLHADTLRDAHQAETDSDWVHFMARVLPIYTGVPTDPIQPFCS